MSKCPVDHTASSSSSSVEGGEKCPVDHSTRSSWTGFLPSPAPASTSPTSAALRCTPEHLPTDREISSIPRTDGEKWVYPSQAQFFAAMARKQHNPQEADMAVIVPIHNAVNERTWGEVLAWENGWGGGKCGGVKLVSFKGRPGDMSPKARLKTLLGYQAPFDRHDWIVDRCGTRLRYVIDFYTGKSPIAGNLAFYLDCRPALDSWEGVKMRASRFWERWVGRIPWQTMGSSSAAVTEDKPQS